jgi:hypothetical protein
MNPFSGRGFMLGETFVAQEEVLAGQGSGTFTGKQVSAGHGFSLNDIARFEAAYQSAGAGADPVASTRVPQAVAPTASASILESPGLRAVMGQLDYMNQFAARIGQDARAISAAGEMSPGDMLMLTVRCHELLFHCELTSNVANRTSDGIQQLFRQQS